MTISPSRIAETHVVLVAGGNQKPPYCTVQATAYTRRGQEGKQEKKGQGAHTRRGGRTSGAKEQAKKDWSRRCMRRRVRDRYTVHSILCMQPADDLQLRSRALGLTTLLLASTAHLDGARLHTVCIQAPPGTHARAHAHLRTVEARYSCCIHTARTRTDILRYGAAAVIQNIRFLSARPFRPAELRIAPQVESIPSTRPKKSE